MQGAKRIDEDRLAPEAAEERLEEGGPLVRQVGRVAPCMPGRKPSTTRPRRCPPSPIRCGAAAAGWTC
jgi:hypothetical protein